MGEPVSAPRRRLIGAVMEVSELCAFPMQARDGSPIVLLHTVAEVSRTNLDEVISGANQQGVVALSTIRDHQGEAVDFEIVALSASAAALMAQPASELIWGRLSKVFPDLAQTGPLAELRRVAETGEHRNFESTYNCPLRGRDFHFRVDAGSIGGLVALSLVDISAIKEREASYRLLFEANLVPMWLVDRQTMRFLAVNSSIMAMIASASSP